MNVVEVLEQAPALLASKAEEVRQARTRLLKVRHNLDTAKAVARVKNREAKNQSILDALVTMDDDVKKFDLEVIEADAFFERKKLEHEEIHNRFISARKMCGLDREELMAIRGSTFSHRP